jgi:phosphonate transport system ATP-binding protein
MNNSSHVVRLAAVNVMAGATALLDDINLVIAARERVAIIGANGAGKTTFLKVLTGMVPITSGSVEVLGHPVSNLKAPVELRLLRSRVGQVFQGLHLLGRLSALENVLVGALGRYDSIFSFARVFSTDEQARAHAALDAVGMGHAAQFRADRLSGGERQKVAIARALNQEPDVILADEPTANLDPLAAAEIAELLARIVAERGMALITVAHTLKLLTSLAQRVIGMRSGTIVFDRAIDDIDEFEIERLYRGENGPLSQIVRA